MTDIPSIFGEKSVEASLKAVPPRVTMGCTCHWDEEGNPPADCRCAERSHAASVAHRSAVLAAAEAALDREALIALVSDVWRDPGRVTPRQRGECFEDWLSRAIVARLFPAEGEADQ